MTHSMSQSQWAAGSDKGPGNLGQGAHSHELGVVGTKQVSMGSDSTAVNLGPHWWVRVSSAQGQKTERADPSGSSSLCPLSRSCGTLQELSICMAKTCQAVHGQAAMSPL